MCIVYPFNWVWEVQSNFRITAYFTEDAAKSAYANFASRIEKNFATAMKYHNINFPTTESNAQNAKAKVSARFADVQSSYERTTGARGVKTVHDADRFYATLIVTAIELTNNLPP